MKNTYILAMIELEALLLGLIGCSIGTVLGAGIVMLVGRAGLNLAIFMPSISQKKLLSF
jgi:ABC-type antimicrobial peptide transport system permease subunit